MAGRLALPLLEAEFPGSASNAITIYNHATSTLSTTYTDATAATTAANPITPDALGDLDTFLAAGDYDLVFDIGEMQETITVTVADSPGSAIQAIAAASATLAINAAQGHVAVVSPSVNVTTTTVTNLLVGSSITIDFISDGTHTFAYPTTCKFAAGAAATASSTSGYRDRYVFLWDGTHLNETSRAIGIH